MCWYKPWGISVFKVPERQGTNNYGHGTCFHHIKTAQSGGKERMGGVAKMFTNTLVLSSDGHTKAPMTTESSPLQLRPHIPPWDRTG